MPILQEQKIGYVQDVRYADFAGAKNRLCIGMDGMPILQEQKIGYV